MKRDPHLKMLETEHSYQIAKDTKITESEIRSKTVRLYSAIAIVFLALPLAGCAIVFGQWDLGGFIAACTTIPLKYLFSGEQK